MGQQQSITLNEMPEIITVKHISEHLHLSKRRVYELIRISPKIGGIESFSIGKSKRVKKENYLNWLNAKQGKNPF